MRLAIIKTTEQDKQKKSNINNVNVCLPMSVFEEKKLHNNKVKMASNKTEATEISLYLTIFQALTKIIRYRQKWSKMCKFKRKVYFFLQI